MCVPAISVAVVGRAPRRRADRGHVELGVLRGRLVRQVVDAVPDQIRAESGRAQEDGDQEEIEHPPHSFNLAAPWDGTACSGLRGPRPPRQSDPGRRARSASARAQIAHE